MNNYCIIKEILKNHDAFKGDIFENEPLAAKTTFKIGGPAELFIAPENFYSFQIALEALLKNNIRFFIIYEQAGKGDQCQFIYIFINSIYYIHLIVPISLNT